MPSNPTPGARSRSPAALLMRDPDPAPAAAPAAAETAGPELPLVPVTVLLSLAVICCCALMSVPLMHLVPLVQGCGISGPEAGQVMLLMMLSAIAGRIAFGRLADRAGAVPAYLIASAWQTLLVAGFAQLGDLGQFRLFAPIYGFGYAGVMTGVLTTIRALVPARHRAGASGVIIAFAWLGHGLGGSGQDRRAACARRKARRTDRVSGPSSRRAIIRAPVRWPGKRGACRTQAPGAPGTATGKGMRIMDTPLSGSLGQLRRAAEQIDRLSGWAGHAALLLLLPVSAYFGNVAIDLKLLSLPLAVHLGRRFGRQGVILAAAGLLPLAVPISAEFGWIAYGTSPPIYLAALLAAAAAAPRARRGVGGRLPVDVQSHGRTDGG
ncbi:MFS transporter [Mangrovicoccus ximenensis]|uniref:MFS transporter n=1 Tax=Mangrovicoccus ximenensis TaxID=1911570 RepID=UPI000D3D3144|nr:MFS transporter [Mangrovicoccus ximenensis]